MLQGWPSRPTRLPSHGHHFFFFDGLMNGPLCSAMQVLGSWFIMFSVGSELETVLAIFGNSHNTHFLWNRSLKPNTVAAWSS